MIRKLRRDPPETSAELRHHLCIRILQRWRVVSRGARYIYDWSQIDDIENWLSVTRNRVINGGNFRLQKSFAEPGSVEAEIAKFQSQDGCTTPVDEDFLDDFERMAQVIYTASDNLALSTRNRMLQFDSGAKALLECFVNTFNAEQPTSIPAERSFS